MPRTVYVHTGPTLTRDDITAVIPDAVVMPPVAALDLLRLPAVDGDVVVIIDGFFQQAQAVRHKEILLLLERGVEVWGAGSMGALRAAELHPLGMRGTGAVFRLYTRGVIEGDDEVGVTHGPAERGYPVMADALVNIRCTVRRAVRDGLVSRDDARDFVAAAQATPFERRTPAALVEAAVDAGVDAAVARRIGALLTERRVDVKRADALRALRRVRHQQVAAAPHTPHVVSDHAHLRLWQESSNGDAGVTDLQVLTACRLFAEDWVAFAAPVALRALAALVSRAGTALPEDDAALAGIVIAGADARGLLHASDARRWQAQWLRDGERDAPGARLHAAMRALAVAPGLPVHRPFVDAVRSAGRFDAAREIARAALAFNDEVAAAHPEFAVSRIDGDRVCAWFAERWSVAADDLDLALLDRGFSNRADFLAAARPFYMAGKFRPAQCGFTLRQGTAAL